MRLVPAVLAALTLSIAGLSLAADAPAPSPVGRWKTISDKTGKANSIVRIWEENGKLKGVVESVIVQPGEDPAPKCDKCKGELKDKPVVGMVILWDLAQDGNEWSGGRILDPDEGETYKCYIEPIENGAKLKVRGYIGFALLGRTQIWYRAD